MKTILQIFLYVPALAGLAYLIVRCAIDLVRAKRTRRNNGQLKNEKDGNP
jgi:hypothetical protein